MMRSIGKRIAVGLLALTATLAATGAASAGALSVTDPFAFQASTIPCNYAYNQSTYTIGYGSDAVTLDDVCWFPEVTGIRRTPYSNVVKRYNYVYIYNGSTWAYLPYQDTQGRLRYQPYAAVTCPDQCFLGPTGDVWWSVTAASVEVPRDKCVLTESVIEFQQQSGPERHYLFNMYCSGLFVESLVDGRVYT